jgi:cytochrome c oxidase subunit 2
MKLGGIRGRAATLAVAASALFSAAAWANPQPWQLNLTKGVTPSAHQMWDLNMASFLVCVVIGIIVFGAMIVAMFRFRKSRGAVAEKWAHNAKLEFAWTIIPVLILIGLAWPASNVLIDTMNTTHSQMTVKVTGYQWKWRYDYLDYMGKPVKKVGFMSRLDRLSDKTRQLDSGLSPDKVTTDGVNTYLLNVNHPLVVPVGVKIRFLITGGDVIHSWWVPDLGVKIDAIPGVINATWAKIEKPGIYRGQCAELCGQDHGFMPIVVKAVPKAQFEQWLATRESGAKLDKAARTAQATPTTAPGNGQG